MTHITKIFRKTLVGLLSLLGFSCFFYNTPDYGVAEYGVPSAAYKAKGVVVSDETSLPIEGIQARLIRKYEYFTEEQVYEIDITTTDHTGSFFLEGWEFPKLVLYVELSDIDGDENGSFITKVIEADFTNATFTGGNGWYVGTAQIDLGTIRMQPEIK